MNLFKNIKEKWNKYLDDTYGVCEKHKIRLEMYIGCYFCNQEHRIEYHKKQKEDRIEETKEAIIRAHKELKNGNKNIL